MSLFPSQSSGLVMGSHEIMVSLKALWANGFFCYVLYILLTDSSREVFTGKLLPFQVCRNMYGNYLGSFFFYFKFFLYNSVWVFIKLNGLRCCHVRSLASEPQ